MRGRNSAVTEAEAHLRSVQGISDGLTLPWELVTGLIGLGLGVFFGPVILASTDEGSRYLERAARSAIGKKGYEGYGTFRSA